MKTWDLVARIRNEHKEIYNQQHPIAKLIQYLEFCRHGDESRLPQTENACIRKLEAVLRDSFARIFIWVRHYIALSRFIVENERLWRPIEAVLSEVGCAQKELLIKADGEEGTLIFKLIRALFQKAYALERGVFDRNSGFPVLPERYNANDLDDGDYQL